MFLALHLHLHGDNDDDADDVHTNPYPTESPVLFFQSWGGLKSATLTFFQTEWGRCLGPQCSFEGRRQATCLLFGGLQPAT